MAQLRLDHLAFPSFNAAETCRFYTEVMGFRPVFAMQGDAAAWKAKSFLLISFEIGDGRVLDFFEYDGIARPPGSPLPKDIQHIAMLTEGADALADWKEKLDSHGVEYWTEEHGPERQSIYFEDPNGILIELTSAPSMTSKPDTEASKRAMKVIDAWTASHRKR